MESIENTPVAKRESIATPIKVVLVGAVMAIIEGVYDIFNANLYTGVIDGIEVTTADIILFTGIAVLAAVAMILYSIRKRSNPTSRAYLVLGVLSLVVLVVGVLFTAVIALLGAGIGYWETRRTPVE